jgi:DNA damage-binding protein 1
LPLAAPMCPAAVGAISLAPPPPSALRSKNTRLEVHRLTEEGLQAVLDVPIYGRISALKLLRPPGEATDLLFLLTERCKFALLQYDAAAGELVTRANGDASEKVGKQCESGQLAAVDPECRAICLHLYDGQLKVIPVGAGGALQEAFNVRLDELAVLDVAFLHGCAAPTLAVLYEDTKEQRHVKTYELALREKELAPGPWAEPGLDPGSNMLIPVRGTRGAIVVGEEAAVLVGAGAACSTSIEPTMMKAYGEVGDDGSRFLLGDDEGNIHLLVVAKDGAR